MSKHKLSSVSLYFLFVLPFRSVTSGLWHPSLLAVGEGSCSYFNSECYIDGEFMAAPCVTCFPFLPPSRYGHVANTIFEVFGMT